MTVDEIKSTYSMRDVLQMYGMQTNRAGFISCPFHSGDRTPSMKIYPKDYHCHACGANGDVFTFVQNMDKCDFKEAFYRLGGEYERQSDWKRKRIEYERQKKKEREEKERESKMQLKRDVIKDISLQQIFVKCFPPFSDDWCESKNKLEYDLYILDELTREGVRLID